MAEVIIRKAEPTPAVETPTKERWERSLYMKQLALELVCDVINAKNTFIEEMEKACEEDGELNARFYVEWALQQAEDEQALDDPSMFSEEAEEEEESEEEDVEEEEES